MLPFRLRVHITQPKMAALFQELHNSTMRFEVSEVRINHSNKNCGPAYSVAGGSTGGTGGDSKLAPDEIVVELNGYAYICQPYDDKKLGW